MLISSEQHADVGFQKVNPVCTLYLFMELSFHIHYMCVAKTIINGGGDQAVGCGLSPLSGIICEIVNSVGQGNLTFSGKRQGKAREF